MSERFRPSSQDAQGFLPKIESDPNAQVRIDQARIANFLVKEGMSPENIGSLTITLHANSYMSRQLRKPDKLVLSHPSSTESHIENLNHFLYGCLHKLQKGKIPKRRNNFLSYAGATLTGPVAINIINEVNGSIYGTSKVAALTSTITAGAGSALVYLLGADKVDDLKIKNTIKLGKKLMEDNKNLPLVYPRFTDVDTHQPGDITLDDVGGLEDVKKKLDEIVVAFTHPETLAKWDVQRPQGVLLYGESGTGKTMLAYALANEIGAEIMEIKSTDIYEKWFGNSMKNLAAIFDKAKQAKTPLILFFDELDSLISIVSEPGPGGGADERNSVAGLFKQEMNSLVEKNPNVLVVATTNHPNRIEESIIRTGRFNYKIYVPVPDELSRQDIIVKQIEKIIRSTEGEDGPKMFADDLNTLQITKTTDGLNGAQIAEIFRRLKVGRAIQEAKGKQVAPISQQEILNEVQSFRQNG